MPSRLSRLSTSLVNMKAKTNLHTSLRGMLRRLQGSSIEFDLAGYEPLLREIEQRGFNLRGMHDEEIKRMSRNVAVTAQKGGKLDDLLVEAYALVREAAQRVLGMRPFDVQLIAGIAMNQGKLVEMQTGEGKTLAAVLPAYLNGLLAEGVHILTFNDYLARRDAEWMGPIYEFLGLSVGCIQEGMSKAARQQAYLADVTYLTAKEAGFDYLRDSLCITVDDQVHRPFHYAIVDEADSILIDEARVPLVIAGTIPPPETDPHRLAAVARNLKLHVDFDPDEEGRNVTLTEIGIDRAQGLLGGADLYHPENVLLLTELNLALHAKALLQRNIDYIVRNGKVELVDELTGRVVEDRHWPDGLQTALEAKEGLPLQAQGRILGSVTLQHFLRSYSKLSGMTATAQPAAEELKDFYGLTIVVVPPNRPCIRVDQPDVVFTHKDAKTNALVAEIAAVHGTGRPILVGTSSVEESDELTVRLRSSGVCCEVLNARTDELEAKIIAQAGALGAITISTNMAGRGTDIHLGGGEEEEHEKVTALGGLYVIGTNRHESLRIDQQLRGRAGRQGDPGTSRFFVSLEDDLMIRYGINDLIPARLRPRKQNEPIDHPVIRSEIARTQRIVEGQHFEIRKTLRKYSMIVEEQRQIVQTRRRGVLWRRGSSSLLKAHSLRHYTSLVSAVGEAALQQAETLITLFHIDQQWADHLAEIARIREGIHLVRLNGQDPLDQFHRLSSTAFIEMRRKTDEAVVETLLSVEISEHGIDLDKAGLKGPSSTWTYLINDDPFEETMKVLIRNIGFASVSASCLPCLVMVAGWAIYQRYFRKAQRRGHL
jgi:preprotein translocase subunit SecA